MAVAISSYSYISIGTPTVGIASHGKLHRKNKEVNSKNEQLREIYS